MTIVYLNLSNFRLYTSSFKYEYMYQQANNYCNLVLERNSNNSVTDKNDLLQLRIEPRSFNMPDVRSTNWAILIGLFHSFILSLYYTYDNYGYQYILVGPDPWKVSVLTPYKTVLIVRMRNQRYSLIPNACLQLVSVAVQHVLCLHPGLKLRRQIFSWRSSSWLVYEALLKEYIYSPRFFSL